MDSTLKTNRDIWNRRARNHAAHTATAPDEALRAPLDHCDPMGWFERDLVGKRVLCLASGGGMQSALFAEAGAHVTVVDLSPEMLRQDREVADRRGYKMRLIEASMDSMPMIDDASHDLVFQPVSSCYIPDISKLYREVARIIVPEGVYVSQHKQPGNLQGAAVPGPQGYAIVEPYFRSGPLPDLVGEFEHRESGAREFLHRWDQLIGELLRAGFILEDLMEPRHANFGEAPGSFRHRSAFIPPYVMLKARRNASRDSRILIP